MAHRITRQATIAAALLAATAGLTACGNTSSASIPLLLDHLARSDKVEAGQKALLIGFGASFSMGSALLRFTGNNQD